MKGGKLFRKAISECKDTVRKSCNKHDLSYTVKSISLLPYQVKAPSDLNVIQRNNAPLETNFRKDGHYKKPPPQQSASVMKLITSKTQGIHRSLTQSFKHRTVVKSAHNLNEKTREKIVEVDCLTAALSLNSDGYIYRRNAPNTRRNAICDEIEKCIVQNGGTLRSTRRDLIVNVNLSNWNLI